MLTTLLIAGLAVILAAAFGLAIRLRRRAAALEGQRMERRFGPEYERVLAERDGDAKAARRELAQRLKRYGTLEVLPLASGARERYLAQWGAVQEAFVDSPARALDEAEALLTRLAEERGYPAEVPFEERVAALSVHHARRVHGYLRVHRVRRDGGSDGAQAAAATEDMRAALLEARALFDSLLNARAGHGGGQQRRRAEEAAGPRLALPGVFPPAPRQHPRGAARGTASRTH
ncbi:hypothetical protein ACIGW3_01245 [Streptomyces sp. NPDC053499]|uniref:hypothetical protein n=1 Tax=Streptomyces sp. NPDC053499 TaxID=3365707 RepID=UPI0037D68057